MIGKFTIPGTDVVCTLDDDLQWQSAMPIIQRDLRLCFNATEPPYSSAAMGARGCVALADAAAAFGAVPEYGVIAEEPGDLVFVVED